MESTTIIHEGCTEKIYLDHLLSLLNLFNTDKLDFHNVEGGGPKRLLDKFETLKDDGEREHIKNYLFIMDADTRQHDDIKSDLLSYKSSYSNFEVISFEPCIEMFLIAHFDKNVSLLQSKAYARVLSCSTILKATGTKKKNIGSACKQSERHLKYHHIPGYSKANCSSKLTTLIGKKEIRCANNQCKSLQDLLKFISGISA